MKWKTQQEPKPMRHLTKSCFYLGSPVLLRQNRHTQRMKCNEFQMMSVFLNEVFHHHALLSLAKAGSAPARAGQWLCWVLVSHSKAWSWVLGSPSWMKSPPLLPPPTAAAPDPSAAEKQSWKSQPHREIVAYRRSPGTVAPRGVMPEMWWQDQSKEEKPPHT